MPFRSSVGVLGLVLCAAASPTPNHDSHEKGIEYVLAARVIDGDTLELASGLKLRLIGVDTPETVHPQKPVEAFGKEASEFTRHMVEGKRVRLEYDWQRSDKYGRTLAYVYLEDGTFLNAELIRQGYGHAYTRFPFKHLDDFRALEREARQQKRGLWAAPREPAAHALEKTNYGACPADRPIKGNRTTRSGACIYHVPGGEYYFKTVPEDCFASEEEAQAAACRKSKR
jgi:micrococcal nuclease